MNLIKDKTFQIYIYIYQHTRAFDQKRPQHGLTFLISIKIKCGTCSNCQMYNYKIKYSTLGVKISFNVQFNILVGQIIQNQIKLQII